MPVKVYYNSQQVSGEPFVSKSLTPMDFGDRWGMTESITLNGTVGYQDTQVGIHNPTLKDGNNNTYIAQTTGLVHHINDVFKVNFKPLEVWDDGAKVASYSWPSAVVESVDFDKSKWQKKSTLKYSVKLKAYDVFYIDAVTEPENSYSFSEGEDGSINVTHKISAKGIKSGTHSPLKRAITFVDKYVGINHQAAGMNPMFIVDKTPVLLSKTENANRLEGTYSVTENWRYNADAAANQPFLKTTKISHNESVNNEFHTVNYDVQYQASTYDPNAMTTLRNEINNSTNANNRFYENQLAAELKDVPSANNIYQVSMSIEEDEAAKKISIKGVYQTGVVSLINGYMDWKVDFSKDEITEISSYSVNGQLKTFGNTQSKKKAVANWKNTYFESSPGLAKNVVEGSQVFKIFGQSPCPQCDGTAWSSNYASAAACRTANNCPDRPLNPYPKTFKYSENSNLGTLTITAEFTDADYIDKVANAKWNVSVTAEKQLYKAIPSANVNGVYVLQDLNCHTMTKTKISANGEVPHARFTAAFPGPSDGWGNYEAADTITQDEIQSLGVTVANVAVPNDPTKYSTTVPPLKFAKELQENSNDHSTPYTTSHSHSWIHTPTLENRTVASPLNFRGVSHQLNWERMPGYKFGD